MKNNFSTAGEHLQKATFKEQSKREKNRDRHKSNHQPLLSREIFRWCAINYHTYSYAHCETAVKLASHGEEHFVLSAELIKN